MKQDKTICDHLFVIKGKRAVCTICGKVIRKITQEWERQQLYSWPKGWDKALKK